MIKLFAAISIFLITGLGAYFISSNKSKTFKLVTNWLLVFMGLIALDFFAEAFVFEWLQWNGTTKNDWFFMLWWLLVFAWFIYGAKKIFQSSN
jgi:hypothetical protein